MNKKILLKKGKEASIGLEEGHETGEIDLMVRDDKFTFQQAEYAPPSGVMATNYARYVFYTQLLLIIN